MKTFSKNIVFILLLVPMKTFAQNGQLKKYNWNGYTQLRFTSNFNDVNSFAMRRMKLWMNSTTDFNEQWGYKIQTTITSFQNEKFLLQDVVANYHFQKFKINIGQFVPEYSLQRFQSDATIPLTERTSVINALIPNGTLGVRDIGLEGDLKWFNKNLETWFGIFNGNGIKEYRFDNVGIMFTNKTAIHLYDKHITTGYSVMYRKAEQLQLKSVLPDSISFTGNDYRFNLFVLFQSEKFQIQTEYLWASLEGKTADGYYILAVLNLGKNQIVTSFDKYNDLINSTDDLSEIHLGYNYLINQDKLKIMLDNSIKVNKGKLESFLMTIQFQIFFN